MEARIRNILYEIRTKEDLELFKEILKYEEEKEQKNQEEEIKDLVLVLDTVLQDVLNSENKITKKISKREDKKKKKEIKFAGKKRGSKSKHNWEKIFIEAKKIMKKKEGVSYSAALNKATKSKIGISGPKLKEFKKFMEDK